MCAVQIVGCNAMVDAEESGCSTVAWTGSPITRGSVGSAGAERERERGILKRAAGKAQHRDPRLCSNPFSKTRPPSFVFNFNEGSDWGTLGGVGREQKQHHSCFGFYKAIPYTIINMSYIVGIRKGQEDSLT